MKKLLLQRQGFTFVELAVVLAIMAILLTLSVVSLGGVQQQAYLSKSLDILLSDIKLQQSKAMNGATEDGNTHRYGIHFETNSYTLFQGDTYDPYDTTNFTVTLDGQLTFTSVTFPNSQIIFEKGSGEIVGFLDGSNTITLSDGPTIVTINALGVFTTID